MKWIRDTKLGFWVARKHVSVGLSLVQFASLHLQCQVSWFTPVNCSHIETKCILVEMWINSCACAEKPDYGPHIKMMQALVTCIHILISTCTPFRKLPNSTISLVCHCIILVWCPDHNLIGRSKLLKLAQGFGLVTHQTLSSWEGWVWAWDYPYQHLDSIQHLNYLLLAWAIGGERPIKS